MLVDNYSLHPNCFRCQHCNQLLSLSNNEKMEGRFFCKAHFKLYISGSKSANSNPLLANARYSSALPLTIETQSAVGRSISGKKAAYESLVNASSTSITERAKTPSNLDSSTGTGNTLKRGNRLERTRSLVNLTSRRKEESSSKSIQKSIDTESLPVFKIVQNCLRLYERREDNLSTPIKRSLSIGAPSLFIPESIPTSRAHTTPAISPTSGTIDPSFAAASRTKLRSRIQSYQGKFSPDSLPSSPSQKDFDDESKSPGKLTHTFKGIVDALINHGQQNNTEIGVRENLARRKSVHVKPTSKAPAISAPIMHPSAIHVKGEITHRLTVSDLDLKEIVDQVKILSPPNSIRDTIQESVHSLDQKLKVKDEHIEKLRQQLADLKSRVSYI